MFVFVLIVNVIVVSATADENRLPREPNPNPFTDHQVCDRVPAQLSALAAEAKVGQYMSVVIGERWIVVAFSLTPPHHTTPLHYTIF